MDDCVDEPVDSTDVSEPEAVTTGSCLERSSHLYKHLHNCEHNRDDIKYDRAVHADETNPEDEEIALSVKVNDPANEFDHGHEQEGHESREKRQGQINLISACFCHSIPEVGNGEHFSTKCSCEHCSFGGVFDINEPTEDPPECPKGGGNTDNETREGIVERVVST